MCAPNDHFENSQPKTEFLVMEIEEDVFRSSHKISMFMSPISNFMVLPKHRQSHAPNSHPSFEEFLIKMGKCRRSLQIELKIEFILQIVATVEPILNDIHTTLANE